jgi:PAS domain S-box-containing protein
MKPKWLWLSNFDASSTTRSRSLAYGFALVSPSALLLLVWVLERGAPTAPLYPLFTLTIVVSALLGGLYPGLLALALSLFYTDYLILLPRYSMSIRDRREWLRFAAFALVGVVISVLIANLRSKREQLKRSEAQLRTIVDSLSERLYVCDSSGRPLVVNETFRKYHAMKDPIYPQSFEEDVVTSDLNGRPLPLSEWPISRALRGEQVQGMELRLRAKDSVQDSIVSYNASPVRDAQGNLIMAVVTSEDITLRKQAEQVLCESEVQFRTLANAIPQLCWMANADGWITWYNERWYQYTGTTPEQMEGWGWQSVHDPQALPEVLARWKGSIASGQPFDMVFPLRGSDGVFRPFLTRVMPVKDVEGKVVRWFGTNTDISAQKKAEETLIRSEKLAATGRLAATIAHEVNNPLEAALNAVYVASINPAQAPQMLMLADHELRRAAHITQQTLGLYREHGSRKPVALPRVIDEVLGVYAGKLQHRNITVHRRYTCGDCSEGCEGCFLVSAGELRQIISSLLVNGIDALRDNGTLYIRVSRVTSFNGSGHNIRLTIADNGCGIRAENLKRIFEPFFTTKESVGTGLGLWATQELVRKHNGVIKVRSRKDKGSVFRITLPAMALSSASESGSSGGDQNVA